MVHIHVDSSHVGSAGEFIIDGVVIKMDYLKFWLICEFFLGEKWLMKKDIGQVDFVFWWFLILLENVDL